MSRHREWNLRLLGCENTSVIGLLEFVTTTFVLVCLPGIIYYNQPTQQAKAKYGKQLVVRPLPVGMLYCLNKLTSRIDQQQAKANRFVFAGWIVYLLGINCDTITLLPNSNSYFKGCFSEEIIIYGDVYGGRFIERYNKFTL